MSTSKIKIGILGYGHLGKGVEISIKDNDDMELIAIFTRRNPSGLQSLTKAPIISTKEILQYIDKIDVLILCGGSATDLPLQTPEYSKYFNTIDSFDTHAKIPEHFSLVDKICKETNHVSLIACGWDPGLFSINRLMSESFLPKGNTYTFWGLGVSQGHSDAIRRIKGVKDAVQYTVPIKESIEAVKNGENPNLSVRDKHKRECFVVLEDKADKESIEKEIKNMKNYFDEYETIVHFISEEELINKHSKMPHGGFVIRSGKSGVNEENKQIVEYSLKLDSNPEFTGNVLVAYARAVYRLKEKKDFGAKTVFDIAPSLISKKTQEELLKEIL